MDRRTNNKDPGMGSPGEAEHWFVRLLEPDCPGEERAAFERWRTEHPSHAAAYRELELLWKRSEDAVRDPVLVAAANLALRRTAAKPWFRRGAFLPLAAASALALLLALAVLPRWLGTPTEPAGTTYSTVAGQQRTIPLKDGSSIVLDTDSEVSVRYSTRIRRVDLLRGRAQFKVHGNPAWPFVVHAQHGTVTAVGTWFQVRIHGECTAVTLIEGKLAIATAAPDNTPQHASLVGGESLAFDRAGHISPVSPADVQAAEGWTQGKLFVHDWRLPDLLAEMNRYNATQLEIGDPSLRDIHVSGVFRSHDPQTMLQLLQRGWPIRAQRQDATHIMLVRAR